MNSFGNNHAVRRAKIKVIGVGGGGSNAVSSMLNNSEDKNIDFIIANTDAQALENSPIPQKIQIGARLTKGLGAGGDPEIGKRSALEDEEMLIELFRDTDMVFVTAGMGGGTGTGAAPEIARIAKEQGVLTVGVVTLPFTFEGEQRRRQAEAGVEAMKNVVDSLLVISNQLLLELEGAGTMQLAFEIANKVLLDAVLSIADIINVEGMINVDFADVKAIMKDVRGMALMTTGRASGENKVNEVVEQIIKSPLQPNISIEGAKKVLINVTAPPDMKFSDIEAISTYIRQAADDSANIIFGCVYDSSLNDEVQVTVIATGFEEEPVTEAPVNRTPSGAEVRTVIARNGGAAPPQRTPIPTTAQPQRHQTPPLGLATPSPQRNISTPAPKAPNKPNRSIFNVAEDDDEYEVPTFLRR